MGKKMKPGTVTAVLAAGVCFLLILCFRSYALPGRSSFRGDRTMEIRLEGDYILTNERDAVRVEGSTITILRGGKYKLSGQLYDGQIIVATGEEEQVTLVLKNVDIHCEDLPPLWVQSADRVKLKLSKDSRNRLSDGWGYEKVPDGLKQPGGCITSRSDLTIDGEGSLEITGNHKNGISCSDDVKIKEGNVSVTAVRRAVKCNDRFILENGSLELTAGTDGIFCEDTVNLQGGILKIHSGRYGIFGYNGVVRGETVSLQITGAKSGIAGHNMKK